MRNIITLITLVLIASIVQAQTPPAQSNAVFEYEKENTQKLYPGLKMLIDLKPGEKCFTNPWAFVESFPCSPELKGTLSAEAENLKGVIYIDGTELKKNRHKNN